MASTNTNKNIFELLSDQSDNEGSLQEVKPKGEKRVRTRGKKTEQQTTSTTQKQSNVNDQLNSTAKDSSRGNKDHRDARKEKGVSSEAHPQDRRSGTGRGKEVSKNGAGKGSWGTYKDEQNKEDLTNNVQEQEEVVEEEEEVVFTLEEYMNNKTKSTLAQQQSQKELDQKLLNSYIEKDGCQLVQKKVNIDDHFHKKGKNLKNKEQYSIAMQTESKDLLGVRSGLQTYSEKPRELKTEVVKEKRVPKQVEEQPTEEQTEENKEEAPVEEKPRNDNRENRGRGGRGRGGRGRGGRGGRGGAERGDRGDRGDRRENRPYKNNNNNSAKVVNVDDDSSFPTLG